MRILPHDAARLAYASVLLAIVCWFVIDFPILRFVLAIGYLFYAACLWRWPWLWLVLLPALLPLFDLAPLSGRFFFDEFDALILVTAATIAAREVQPKPLAPVSREVRWVLALLAISYFVSTLIRIWPPPAITADSFANYTSPYNSLRVAKGFVWALLLIGPLRRAAQHVDVRRVLGAGFLLGLTGVALVSLYERWLFPGVFTWVTEYRTTASFSSMHTGDGPIDVWLAMTMPFLLLLLAHRRWAQLLPLTATVFLLSTYALFATQSRGPVIAVVLAYAVGLLALLATRKHRSRVVAVLVFALAAAVLLASGALPVLVQSSFGQRFMQTGPDAEFRLNHWRNALALRDQTLSAELFGMGLGSYSVIHEERSTNEPRAARYRFVSRASEHFLTLWSGQNLYMGQSATAEPNSTYSFRARVRTSESRASFKVAWCEVWMLYSANCTWSVFALQAMPGHWQALSRTIHTNEVGSGRTVAGLLIKRPTKLTFFVTDAPNSGVDVGEVSVTDVKGRELLTNTDFALGSDNWFWAVDDHLQWHAKNLAVNILFDQGWLGILAVGMLLSLTLWSQGRQIASGDQLAAIYLASLVGFLVTGVTVSTFDQPRLVLAFLLICFATLLPDRKPAAAVVRQSS